MYRIYVLVKKYFVIIRKILKYTLLLQVDHIIKKVCLEAVQ